MPVSIPARPLRPALGEREANRAAVWGDLEPPLAGFVGEVGDCLESESFDVEGERRLLVGDRHDDRRHVGDRGHANHHRSRKRLG